MDFSHPLVHSFLTVQVIGFPIAFLARAATRLWRASKSDGYDRARTLREAAAYGCFAATSIAFAFNMPAGIALLIVGVVLSFQAFKIGRSGVAISA